MVQFTESGGSYAFEYDHRGSVFNITDASQNIAQSYEHDAWGVRLASEGNLENPLQYQACAWLRSPDLSDTALSPKRAYSPECGRWHTPEGLGYPGKFVYAGNCPPLFCDPRGRKKVYVFGWEQVIDEPVYQRLEGVLLEFWVFAYEWERDDEGSWCCNLVQYIVTVKRKALVSGIHRRKYRILVLREFSAYITEAHMEEEGAEAVQAWLGGKAVAKLVPGLGLASMVSDALAAAGLWLDAAIVAKDLIHRKLWSGHYYGKMPPFKADKVLDVTLWGEFVRFTGRETLSVRRVTERRVDPANCPDPWLRDTGHRLFRLGWVQEVHKWRSADSDTRVGRPSGKAGQHVHEDTTYRIPPEGDPIREYWRPEIATDTWFWEHKIEEWRQQEHEQPPSGGLGQGDFVPNPATQ